MSNLDGQIIDSLAKEVARLTEAFWTLHSAVAPFARIVNTTSGRIPTERLSFADWHRLTTQYNRAGAPLAVDGPEPIAAQSEAQASLTPEQVATLSAADAAECVRVAETLSLVANTLEQIGACAGSEPVINGAKRVREAAALLRRLAQVQP